MMETKLYNIKLILKTRMTTLIESWITNGNVTCYWNPTGVKMGLYPATAMAEFQILRNY